MKTNSKEVRNEIKKHILESVNDFEGNLFTSLEGVKKHVKSEFERVANYPYNLKKIPNNQERFSDYLCGLPFNFHYSNEDIVNFIEELGINPEKKEYSSEKSMKLYHYLIFKEIFS